ncbi:MAG: choline dehydrogenase [Candidatus Thiodiazotropha sp.]
MNTSATPADGGTFDYVIVGAGSAGAVLAARLSEDPDVSVCLLEAGPRDTSPLIHVPFGLAVVMRQRSIEWNFRTAPQTELNGRKLYWPRGRTLGGSSSINAMVYIRGIPDDYNEWAQLGATGWDWENVLPYFKKSEDQELGEDEFHGKGGPLTVSNLRYVNRLSKAFVKAGTELRLNHNEDFNAAEQEGIGVYQVTQRNGQRCSSAVAYLRDAEARPNLTLFTGALAQRVRFKGNCATGVDVRREGAVQTINARREVLLCGGAINSPQLLMLSGVGPAAHLREHGITPVADLAGVGQNLQDHLDVIVQGTSKSRAGYAIAPTIIPRGIGAGINYMLRRQGFLTSNVAEAGGFVRVSPEAKQAEVQYHFLPVRMRNHGRETVFGYGYSLHTCCLKPKSRGEIRLSSADPAARPVIDPRFLSDEYDVRTMIEGVKLGRRILAAPAFAAYRGTEVEPGEQAQSDDDLLAFIRSHGETIYHPVGTCRMGSPDDPHTVVDPELRVIGTERLRVVDASVMPRLISGNTNAPTIMIGERVADLIRGRTTV